MLIFMYLSFSVVAASSAAGSVPAEPKTESSVKLGNEEDINDSARLIYSVFGVQHGPRWLRSVCTTRSTAAPSKNRGAPRRNRGKRGPGLKKSSGATDESDGAEVKSGDELNNQLEAMGQKNFSPDAEVSFFDCWQKSFVLSGKLHIEHGAFLEMSVCSMAMIALTLLWLTHLRLLARGSFDSFYAGSTPLDLFQAYGAPGTAERGFALLLELLLLGFTGERLYAMCCLLQAAALSLQQRHKALLFANDHPPPPLLKNSESEVPQATLVADTEARLDEYLRCSEFASELSSLRWAIVKTPVLLTFAVELLLLALSIFALSLTCVELASDQTFPKLHDILEHIFKSCGVDPLVPLGIALCFAWPMLSVLVAAALSNSVVRDLRQAVRQDVVNLPDASGDVSDVQYVALRLKADQALADGMVCWPGGREVSFVEASFLLLTTALACGLAVVTGGALPGVVSGAPQTL